MTSHSINYAIDLKYANVRLSVYICSVTSSSAMTPSRTGQHHMACTVLQCPKAVTAYLKKYAGTAFWHDRVGIWIGSVTLP